jgi:hypothetical protein
MSGTHITYTQGIEGQSSFRFSGFWCSLAAIIAILVSLSIPWFATANGSLSGTVKDPSGAVIPGAKITLINAAIRSEYTALSNEEGFYSFPALPVGHYDLTIEAAGFKTESQADLNVDTDSALTLRAEAFNVFNHAQFYGAGAVDGEVNNDPHFGQEVSAASPRLMQLAAKFTF